MKDPVPIVLVGLRFGAAIARQLEELGRGADPPVRLAGLCDADPERLAAVAGSLGGNLRRYASLAEVLADPAVPAVGLFTGPNGRARLLREILAAGKDCMTTKPFETDPDAAAAVLAEARRLGRVVHLNSPAPRPAADMAAIARWRDEHALGRPVAAQAATYANYREEPDGSWYDDPARCPVAPIFRLGIYLVNDLVTVFGRAAAVTVHESRLFTGRPTGDNALLSIRFESGALASVFSSFCVRDGRPWSNELSLHFENGTVLRNAGAAHAHGEDAELALVQPTDSLLCAEHPAFVERLRVREGSGRYDWAGFAAAVRREPGAPLHYASDDLVVEPLRIVEAMRAAAETRRETPVRHAPLPL